MRKIVKRCIVIMMAVMVLFTMTPHTAEAAPKKSVTVSVKNAAKSRGKYQLTVKKSAQLVVKYGKSNVTKKAKYTVSNKKIATVSKKGKVTAKKTGSVTVTVKYKGKTKKVKFTVTKPSAAKTPVNKKGCYKEGNTEHHAGDFVDHYKWVKQEYREPEGYVKETKVDEYTCECGYLLYSMEDLKAHQESSELGCKDYTHEVKTYTGFVQTGEKVWYKDIQVVDYVYCTHCGKHVEEYDLSGYESYNVP